MPRSFILQELLQSSRQSTLAKPTAKASPQAQTKPTRHRAAKDRQQQAIESPRFQKDFLSALDAGETDKKTRF